MKADRSNHQNLVLLMALTIILLSFIIYLPSINGEFVYDDNSYIVENLLVQNLNTENLVKIWSSFTFGNYNPVTITSLAFDYLLFENNTFGYHLVNIILHIVNSILIFYFVLKLIKNQWIAIITAILFSIHPIHIESVSWISGRKDLLYSVFFILSMIYYLKYINNEKKKFYILTFIFFTLSCLSKAVAITLPLILILFDYFQNKKIVKKNVIDKLPFLLFSLILAFVAIYGQSTEGAVRIQEQYSVIEKISLSFYAIIFYIFKIILPINLSAIYPFPKEIDALIYLSPLFITGLTLLVFYLKKYNHLYLSGYIFFIITLLPVLQIAAIGNAITADRFAYMAVLPFFIMFAFFIHKLYDKFNNFRNTIISLSIALMLLLTYSSNLRASIWKDEFSLFKDMIAKHPETAFPYNNLGLAYFEKKDDIKSAIMNFEIAIKIKPDYSMAYNNLANVYDETGDLKKALNYYLMAIRTDSNNAVALNNCGLLYYKINEFENAKIMYQKALRLNPDYYDVLNNYGNLLSSEGDFENALIILQKALKVRKDYPNTYINLAGVYYEMNDMDKAEELLIRSLKIDPGNKDARQYLNLIKNNSRNLKIDRKEEKTDYFSLGNKFSEKGDFDNAIKMFKKVIDSYPDRVDACINLAIAYGNKGLLVDSEKTFLKALELQPDNPVIYKNLAVVYSKMKNNKMLVKSYRKAAQLGDLPAQQWLMSNGIKW